MAALSGFSQGFSGADPIEMRRLASKLNQEADAMTELLGNLRRKVGATQWKGLDADKFRAQHWESIRGAMAQAAFALRNEALRLQRHAGLQTRTSTRND
ncbi:MAG: hypothetical protein LBJ02_05335 [Bifidobacteriaceae bacterium]|nr:hypothetical protein [Bifidobacteriaceae bacterium]